MNYITRYITTTIICIILTLSANAQGYKDVTRLYIKNASQASANGWTYTRQQVGGGIKEWSQTCKAYHGSYVSEVYAGDPLSYTTFEAKQTITLPQGTYHLVGKAFQRDVPDVKLFAEIDGTRAETQVGSVYGQFASATTDLSPNGMESAAQAFNANMYLNELTFTVTADDTPVVIGYEGEFTDARQWFIFGAMTLYQEQNEVSNIYSIDITPSLNRSFTNYTGLTGLYAKADAYIHEKYSGSDFPEGDLITQTFTGLENGIYQVVINANASKANGVGTVPKKSPYVYAADAKATVTVETRNDVATVGQYVLRNVIVADGTMRVGFYNQASGGNWYLFNVKSVKYCGTNITVLATRYKQLLTAAKSLQGKQMQACVSAALDAAIAQAETDVDTESKEWLEQTISTLNTAIAAAQTSTAAYATTIPAAVSGMKAQSIFTAVADTLQAWFDAGVYATAEEVYDTYRRLELEALPLEPGTDYTSAIINPGFELGNTDGWSITTKGTDTGIRTTSSTAYNYSGTEGSYLFYTTSTGITTLDISQTITGLANGYYAVSATVAGFGDQTPIIMSANSQKNSVRPSGSDIEAEVVNGYTLTVKEAFVYDGTLTITIQNTGKGNTLFKADNIRLTYLRPYKPLDTYTGLNFTVNLENSEVARFLANETYTEQSASAVTSYDLAAGFRYDQPAVVSIPLPAQDVEATLTVSLKADFTDAETHTIAAGSVLYELANLIPQQHYYYKIEAGGNTIGDGQIHTTGRLRMIKADSGFNIRDLGGWLNTDGNRLRYGLIYRGGEMNANHVMNSADLAEMARLDIKAEVDLRTNADISGFGIKGSAIDGAAYTYENLNRWSEDALNFDAAKFRDAFNLVLQTVRSGHAVYFHCIYGADRTGCFAFLLEGLLGLPVEQLYKDYELTSFSSAGLREKTGIDHKLQYIKALEGSTLQEKFYTYWRGAIGIDEADLNDFINIMVDGTSPITTATHAEIPGKAVADGEYYIYLPTYDLFLERGMAFGTRGIPGHYGIPVSVITNGVGVSTIRFLDNNLYLGSDGYTDKAIFYNSISWFIEKSSDSFILKSLNGKYLEIYEDNRIRVETESADNATPIRLLTQAEQKTKAGQWRQDNILAAANAAGMDVTTLADFNATLAKYTRVPRAATIKSPTAGSTTDWVLSEPYARNETNNFGNAYNVGTYGGELYQKNASVSQTVSVPHAGLYKLTFNAFYRQGTNADCYSLGLAGYDNLSTAYASINDTYFVQIPSWYSGCTDGSSPNDTDAAKALINQGKYRVELYAYIDESEQATITINVPGFTPFGWCLFTGFVLTAYLSPDDADGIISPAADTGKTGNGHQAAIYDLTGRQVTHPAAGIYIVDGKKIVIK